MRFESPWAFLLLLAVALLPFVRRGARRGASLLFPTTRQASRAGRSWRQRLDALPDALRLAALVCLTVALARPQEGIERMRDTTQGIAIQMVIDRSGSMSAEMNYGGRPMNRLEAVKQVFEEFVMGNGRDLPGRPNDLIGIVAFARYPDTVCPLTLAHDAFPGFLQTVQLAERWEDGTAIGDALALAAARLKTVEETLGAQAAEPGTASAYEIESRVIILLTDGENNYGRRTPLEAARLAADWGIRVYAIGVGGGETGRTIRTPLGSYTLPAPMEIDEPALRAIAETTGGLYRRAADARALHAIYREIDQLERSEIETVRYLDYGERFAPFALCALALLVVEVFARTTVFRRIP